MPIQYSVNQYPIQTLLAWITSDEIAIPEIQRPFVWKPGKVAKLIDSLYNGYPIGYLITWRNPNIRLKDGTISTGKRILIDGQQRVTAIMAALLGKKIVNKDYQKKRIKISFNPSTKEFKVFDAAIERDKEWINDISVVFSNDFRIRRAVDEYCELNNIENLDDIHDSFELLKGIVNNPIGLIELNCDLDIETVTEIFIRINSTGVSLNQADFAMSKIAVDEKYGGNTLRKAIDYFCHMSKTPEFYDQLVELDESFTHTEYFRKMEWLKNENDYIYIPSYIDMLRVAFTSEFKRGKLEDLVALLSGRDFETREYKEVIAEESFRKLRHGILNFMNETNFNRFDKNDSIGFAFGAEEGNNSVVATNIKTCEAIEEAGSYEIKTISTNSGSKSILSIQRSDKYKDDNRSIFFSINPDDGYVYQGAFEPAGSNYKLTFSNLIFLTDVNNLLS
jgi:hypothetical protein